VQDPKQSLSEYVQSFADDIWNDLTSLNTLQKQRKLFGPQLKTPLPLSLADSKDQSLLCREFMPYVGDFSAFSDKLEETVKGRQQIGCAVAVTQASGSGKSRLAYAEGMANSIVVFVRIALQGDEFTSSWQQYLQFILPLHKKRRTNENAKRALNAMQLLIACYARWVLLILQRLPDSASSKQLQEVALRCLRNGRGDEGVRRLFVHYCKAFRSKTRFWSSELKKECITRLLTDTDRQLRELTKLPIVIWYDEAQALMGEGPVFSRRTSLDRGGFEVCDALYGLTAAMTCLMDNYRWRQAFCGPYFQLSDKIKVAEFSTISERVAILHHASRIEVADMLACLQHFFGLEPECFSLALREQLAMFRGRPKWFYDKFWGQLHVLLQRNPPETPEDLLGTIGKALKATDVKTHAEFLVGIGWNSKEEADGGFSLSRVHKELYLAVKLNNAKLTIRRNDAIASLVRLGIFALAPAAGIEEINLFEKEPIMAHAIEYVGDQKVLESTPSTDPIFSLLRTALSAVSLDYTESIKGPAFENAAAWYFVRHGLKNSGPRLLSEVLGPLLPATVDVPEQCNGLKVEVHRGLPASTAEKGMDFAVFAERSDAIVTALSEDAGADLAFCCRDADDRPVLALIQAKA
jgi:hypothetical protein